MKWGSQLGRVALLMLLGVAVLWPAKSFAVPPVMETPDALYLQVDRPGFAATYLTGIAANGRISGVSTIEPMPNSMPPQYVNAQGFLLSGSQFTDITLPDVAASPSPVRFTCPLKLNASGDVVGWATDSGIAGKGESGWIWRRGAFRAVEYTGPDTAGLDPAVRYTKITDVMGINARGEMVGQVAWIHPDDPNVPLSHWRGWLYSNGEFRLIDPPDSLLTYPADINERGEVVGVYRDQPAPPRPGFLRRPDGVFEKILLPYDWGAFLTFPQSINARGTIVGLYVAVPGQPHGFVLANGKAIHVDVPGSLDTAVYGINESGHMVGAFKGADNQVHGFIRIPKR
jgi:hypothetical protein